ncbi:Clathrin coat assembly AP180, partial, partial [Paramuricea clavata]
MAEYVADKLDAARHSITGSNVSKIVCKASSREIFGPKKKHLDYLIACTESDNISVPSLAELLFERSHMSSWVIVSKSLVTFHNLMSAGNERFLQYLASRTTLWNLENFLDKSGVLGYDMSTFIRRYSHYLTKKAHTYTEAGYDFCRIGRGQNGQIRKMDTPKILKALPQIQQQVDSLLEVDVQSIELGNAVINSAFVMLFKDLVKLFACYNDGMINLLEKFFEMNKKSCKEALEIYKKFLSRMDSVKEFLKVAEDVGINPSDIPDLTKAPSSLMEALESHYQSLEKGKVPVASSKRPNLQPINVPQLTTESLNNPIKFEDYKKEELIKEEEHRLNSFK